MKPIDLLQTVLIAAVLWVVGFAGWLEFVK